MLYWTAYKGHQKNIIGKRKKFDSNIYTFDIETTSYIYLNEKIFPGIDYLKLSEEDRQESEKRACMYIWMMGINDTVYYGRTWQEYKSFLKEIEKYVPEKKIVFVHNLAFEFQFLIGEFEFENVVARTSHKVMYADMVDYNYQFRCTYLMTNTKLSKLSELYNLPVKKLEGDLDYTKIRTSVTKLTEKELGYCENDCLVVYHYILYELHNYKDIKSIPKTSTGHVRRELQELIRSNYKYKRLVNKAINTDPHVYNRLQEAFMGGYTHANWVYADKVLKSVDSWDFTSSYPYVMCTYKFPSTEFKKCNIKSVEEMSRRFAYLLVVRFTDIESNYFNSFISASKCRNISGAVYDNGRIIKAKSLEITLTDVDFRFLLKAYTCQYEILECYYSIYNYLPRDYINFILKKYVIKTQYKNVLGKEVEYQKEKSKFNSLYGMSVTNTIRDEVKFENGIGWTERELTNEEIEEALLKEKKKSFLSFAYGVWVTAWARNNLLENVLKLDEYVVYCDTDSIKVLDGYNKSVIENYNKSVVNRINVVSTMLRIPISKFSPKDSKGVEHMLGLFDPDGHYEEFITQGAKKYAVKEWIKDKKTGETNLKILITVAGVPKSGAKALHKLDDFRDDFVFHYKDTNKNLLKYVDNMKPIIVEDYLGNKLLVKDKTGCCLLPTTYILGKALDYANLISGDSSKRARYKEE